MSLSTNTTYRVLVEKLGATEAGDFIGNEGEVFYDPSVPELLLSDGSTPGGLSIGGGGGGSSQWTTTGNGIYYQGGNVAIGTNVVSAGSTTLLVDGNARITGILTIGTSSITLDGSTNQINIGSQFTLSESGNMIISPTADPTTWALTYGDTGIGVTEQSHSAVGYDSQGNIYATGADYDNGIPFLVKFDTYGSIIWQKFFDHPDPDKTYKVCETLVVDKATDDVYITVQPDDNVESIIVVKLNSDSDIIWQQEIADSNGYEYSDDMTLDSDGNVYIVGATNSQGAGGYDAFIVKLDSDGTELWQRTIGDVNYEAGQAVVTDSNNNVYVVGQTDSQGAGANDALIVKLDSDGTELWQRIIGDVNSESGFGVATDSNNNVYVVGRTNSQGAGYYDALIVKLNSDGTELWQRTIGDVNYEAGQAVVTDSNNNVYVTGEGNNKIYIHSWDSSGNLIAQKQLYSGEDEYQWYYNGHNLIDIRNDKLVIGGYTYNTAPEYYSEGFLMQIPTSLVAGSTFTNENNPTPFKFESSNLTVGISTFTVGVSTFTVATSTLPISAGGLTTATSPPNYVRELYANSAVGVAAGGESFFDSVAVNNLNASDLNINGLPFGKSSGSQSNFFVGRCAGYNNTTGSYNNFLGESAGRCNTTGYFNNFLGGYAGYCNTTGSFNNFFGYYAGRYSTTGCHNNFLGSFAGRYNTTGCYNNFLGRYAGFNNTIGNHNTFLGSFTGISTSASNKIILGRGNAYNQFFDSPDITKNTQFAVGVRTDANPSKYWLVGNENFDVGIGTTNPTQRLEVQNGNIKVGVNTSNGLILTDSNGVSWRLIVNTDGTLTTAAV